MSYLGALIVAALLLSCCTAPAPQQHAQATQYGGRCIGVRPICSPGLHPECICYDAFGNNCTWQCVR